nr:immunoglobulin light chain junction region [Macaca mulatta]MOW61697.1 immunoglobulin light chain junction region [Macaca mulatta]MOW61774.1 immunoglobulin light chain junction region [Macaca mulatta]MOW62621.1 immunoglobulin light chain junction region [Macaca mulatta]MOW63068.1 immunoglobulin light chain junction region [Macaca mulatta]
CVQAIAFPYTF